jgi:VanZ family protein
MSPRWRQASLAALLGYWGLLFVATHYPRPEQITPQVSDKFLHFAAYAVLALLCVLALLARRALRRWDPWVLLGALAAYGALDELLQIPVNRHCDLNDWIADMGGVASVLLPAAVAAALWRRRSAQREP